MPGKVCGILLVLFNIAVLLVPAGLWVEVLGWQW